MFLEKFLNLKKYIFLLIILFLGLFFRLEALTNQPIHSDEELPLVNRLDEFSGCYLLSFGNDYNKKYLVNKKECRGKIKKEITVFENLSPFSLLITADDVRNNAILFSAKISSQMTFAPLYTFVSSFLINDQDRFNNKIIQLRFLSFILSTLSIITLFMSLNIYFKDFVFSSFLTTFYSLGLMASTYGGIGFAYGTLTFFVSIQYILTTKVLKSPSKRNYVFLTFFNIISFYYDWSMVLFSLPIYLCLLVDLLQNNKDKNLLFKRLVSSGVVYSIFCFPGIFVFLIGFSDLLESSQTRNDIFKLGANENIFIDIFMRLKKIIFYNFSITSYKSINEIISIIFLTSFFLGVASVIKISLKRIKPEIIYVVSFLFLIFIGSFLGLQKFIPSRNSLIYCFPLLFIIGIGINTIFKNIKIHKEKILSSLIIILIILSVHNNNYSIKFSNFWKDNKKIEKIRKIINQNNIKTIVSYEYLVPWLILKEQNLHVKPQVLSYNKKNILLDFSKDEYPLVLILKNRDYPLKIDDVWNEFLSINKSKIKVSELVTFKNSQRDLILWNSSVNIERDDIKLILIERK